MIYHYICACVCHIYLGICGEDTQSWDYKELLSCLTWMLGTNLNSLQEQQALLITKASLQLLQNDSLFINLCSTGAQTQGFTHVICK